MLNTKKLSITVLIVILAISFAGCKNEVNISEAKIKNTMVYNEINNASYKDFLYEMFGNGSEAKEQLQKMLLPTKTDEVKMYLEEMKKICDSCQEKGVLINKETVDSYVENSVEQLKTDESQTEYYQSLIKVLENKNVSFEMYVTLAKEQYYYTANKNTLKTYFKENGYKENSKKSLDEQFEDYIKKLD